MSSQLREIPVLDLRVSQAKAQLSRRESFSQEKLAELAESIRVDGILQALVVRPIAAAAKVPGHYEIIAGERRFLAAQIAGLERVPCSIRDNVDEEAVIRIQLIENLQREDVHPMHEAEGYDELLHVHKRPVEEIVAEVGKSRAYVYGRMKLLALSKTCRKAFYGSAISASIAEKLARIPTHKLQDEALEAVLGNPNAKQSWQRREPMSYRQAAEHINETFMLDLSHAPFPTEDPDLNGAGPCGTCPKRAGNQPELFADVKKGDTCTDTVCFAAKVRAYGQRLLEQAKTTGQHTITGGAAKKVAPNGVSSVHDVREGYMLVDEQQWLGGTHDVPRKHLKPDATIALLQDPKSGRVVEVVHQSQLKKPKRESSASSSDAKWKNERKAQAARARVETAVRRAVFLAIAAKGKWKAPPLRVTAELIAESMDYDAGEALMDLLGIPESKGRGFFDRLKHHVKGLKTDAELEAFIAQAYLGGELHVNSYAISSKMERLEAAAKTARVDVKKIRAELTPKKKPAKKTAKAKPLHKRKGMARLLKAHGRPS